MRADPRSLDGNTTSSICVYPLPALSPDFFSSRIVTIDVSVFTARCSMSYFYQNLGNHGDVSVTIDQGHGQG